MMNTDNRLLTRESSEHIREFFSTVERLSVYRVGQGHYCPLPPSEPYVRVSPHTAQAFQSLCSCAETGSYYFLFPLDLRDNLKHSS